MTIWLIRKFLIIFVLMVFMDIIFPGHPIEWITDIGFALISTIFTTEFPPWRPRFAVRKYLLQVDG